MKFDQCSSTGVLTYTINDLTPDTTYYFMVRGGNGCMPGDWGNWLSAKTVGGIWQKLTYYFSY